MQTFTRYFVTLMFEQRWTTAAVMHEAATAAPSSPQLGGIVFAASRKKRQAHMKRNIVNTAAVSLKRRHAGRCTAVGAQPPQLGSVVVAASRRTGANAWRETADECVHCTGLVEVSLRSKGMPHALARESRDVGMQRAKEGSCRMRARG